MKEMKVNVLLYDGFEALDAFGPVEVLGSMEEFELQYVSLEGGMVKSWQGFQVDTVAIQTVSVAEILLVPGARNVRPLLEDAAFMQVLKEAAEASQYCLTVCTGSALLCKTGLLNGKKATSNKMAFAWVKTLNDLVDWQGCALDEGWQILHSLRDFCRAGYGAGICSRTVWYRTCFERSTCY